MKKNIPYGQLLRGKRICSNQKDFEIYSDHLKKSFVKRGYKEDELATSIERSNTVSRAIALQQVPKAQNNRMTFITTYNRTNPNIKEVLQKHWHLLQLDTKLANIFSEQPMIAFKRNKNLGDFLGSKSLKNSKVVRNNKSITIKRCKPCTKEISKNVANK